MKFSTLTIPQQEVLEIVLAYSQVNGESPSLRDILKKSKTITSLRGVALQLNALEKAGYISRDSSAKSIEVNVTLVLGNDHLIEIPLFLGSVQAGMPTLFEEYTDSTITVKLSATKGLKNVFAFKVRGESMRDLNISEGDYAIVTESISPNNGDVVVALIEDGITLKTYRLIDGHAILFPANKEFKPIVEGFEIRGKLVNIIKPQMMEYFQKLKKLI